MVEPNMFSCSCLDKNKKTKQILKIIPNSPLGSVNLPFLSAFLSHIMHHLPLTLTTIAPMITHPKWTIPVQFYYPSNRETRCQCLKAIKLEMAKG